MNGFGRQPYYGSHYGVVHRINGRTEGKHGTTPIQEKLVFCQMQ